MGKSVPPPPRPPGSIQFLYESEITFMLQPKGRLHIGKNRFGHTGDVNLEEAIDVCSLMLVMSKYKGSMKLFQEGDRILIKEALKKILLNKENKKCV